MLITLQKPIIGPLLKNELADLRREGITPDPDEIIWLYKMCAEVVRPNLRAVSKVFSLPVKVGEDVYLYSPTWAARMWYDSTCRPAMEGMSPAFKILTLGFYYSIGKRMELFEKLITKSDINRAVTQWASRLNVTIDELQEGLALVTGETEDEIPVVIDNGRNPAVREYGPTDYGELVGFLSHYYNANPQIIWTLPDELVQSMIDTMPIIMQQENPINGGSQDGASDEAFWRMKMCVKEIRKAHTPKTEPEAVNG